jgi:hypothetical protein
MRVRTSLRAQAGLRSAGIVTVTTMVTVLRFMGFSCWRGAAGSAKPASIDVVEQGYAGGAQALRGGGIDAGPAGGDEIVSFDDNGVAVWCQGLALDREFLHGLVLYEKGPPATTVVAPAVIWPGSGTPDYSAATWW